MMEAADIEATDEIIASFRERYIEKWVRTSYDDDYLYYWDGGGFRPAEPSQAQASEQSEARRGWAK